MGGAAALRRSAFAPADCGASSACLAWECSSGKCIKNAAAEGTQLPEQTMGDCSTVVCDGQGSTKQVYEPTDAKSDGSECTVDACSMQGTTHAAKPTGTPCSGGLCSSSQACVAHIPVKCQIKNGGALYVGCDGSFHAGLTISFGSPMQLCNGDPNDVGYCQPGSTCAVVIAGGMPQLGTCQ